MKDRTFCDANHQIRNLVQDIICEVEMAIKYEETNTLETVMSDLTVLEQLVEETQEYAEKMENRLKSYRNAIEQLGLNRVK